MALVLAGQLGMAVVLDHNGWAGFRDAPLTVAKALGIALIIGGVHCSAGTEAILAPVSAFGR